MIRQRSLQPFSRGLIVAFLGIAALAGGCEAIVGDSVPSGVSCTAGIDVCPESYECIGGTCTACVTPDCITIARDAGVDSPVVLVEAGHDTSKPVIDAGHDVAIDTTVPDSAPPGELGDPCGVDTTCMSGLCALPSDLPGLSFTNGFCSEPCCADTDCAGTGTFACYATAGGNLCVPSTVANCSASSCPTPCCGTTGCSGSESCALPDAGDVPSCQPFGGDTAECSDKNGAGDDDCGENSDCMSGLCVSSETTCSGGACTSPCCNDSQCTDDHQSCQWLVVTLSGTPTGVVHACASSDGLTKSGGACTTGSTCAGSVCSGSVCSGPCCTDADCASLTGGPWACLPYQYPLSVGSISVLACQQTRP
jgi:hypothetical protein